MLRDLKMEVFYPYPPQKVWQVLTNRRALAQWLMENDFEPHVGHKFQFQHSALPGLDGNIDCEVLEIDEPRRLSFTWQDSMMYQPSIVTWTLEPVNGGTRLQLQHKGLSYNVETLHVTFPDHLSQPWQSQFRYESTVVNQTPTMNHTTTFRSIPVGRYEEIDSVILGYFFNGGWDYKLNQRLTEFIVGFTTDNN